jgi:phage-related protein
VNKFGVRLYETAEGDKPVADFLRHYKRNNRKVFKKCLQYIKALEENGLSLPFNYIRHVEGAIWELRPESGGVEYRLFFGQIGSGAFGIVSAYQKTWDRVPEQIKRLASERIREMGEQ